MADLEEKTDRYERMLADALAAATVAVPPETPLGTAAADCEEMARSYLDDGRHFRADDDYVNALASFSYGWACSRCRTTRTCSRCDNNRPATRAQVATVLCR